MAASIFQFGPPPERASFDVRDPKQFKAWEEAWASFNGQQAPADNPVVKQAPKSGEALPVDPAKQAAHAEALGYLAEYTGSFGFLLDLRSDRRWGTKYMHLTDGQVGAVLKCKARDIERTVQQTAARAKPALEDGWYRFEERVYKVVHAVNGSGHQYAKVLVLPGDRTDLGHDPVLGDAPAKNGRWEYAPGVVKNLEPLMALSLEEAAEMGRLYGICMVCGRLLTDETSIEAGIGPVCSGRLAAGLATE